jgi:hypothetical protein
VILVSVSIVAALIVGMLFAMEVGYRFGRRYSGIDREQSRAAAGTLEAAVFALMGLLVAFTFNGAATRFESRRNIIVREANAIGTSYLRLDLLPVEARTKLQQCFRTYLQSRLAVGQKIPDLKSALAELARSKELQREIWREAVAGVQGSDAATRALVLGSINQMIDITTESTAARTTHPPTEVYIFLVVTVLTSSGLAGYAMSVSEHREWIPVLTFALVLSSGLYLILDYEFPRVGTVRIDFVDRVLVETLEQMK